MKQRELQKRIKASADQKTCPVCHKRPQAVRLKVAILDRSQKKTVAAMGRNICEDCAERLYQRWTATLDG